MDTRESIIAKAVAKNLKKYLHIQRREQGFDLSDPYHPVREPQTKLKVHVNNFFKEDVDELAKSSELKHQINKMQSSKDLSDHETVTRINLEREMSRYNNPTIVSPYTHPVQMRRRVHKKRIMSASKVGRGQKVYRRAPPQKITNTERDRIVNLTTKLLVATETIALPQNRKQSREIQTSSEDSFPAIPAVRRVQNLRPKSAYSDPGQRSNKLNTTSKSARTRSAEQTRKDSSLTSTDDDSIRNQSSDFHVKKLEHGYLVRKHPAQTSLRPKSAVISSRFKPPPKPADSDSFEDDEEFYTHASTEVSPVATPRTVWSESDKLQADTSTQTSITTGTQTNKATPKHTGSNHIILPKVVDKASDSQVSSSDELSYREQPSSEDMSTQTRRRSVEPKVVTYEVYVVTGNKLGSSTNSDVIINIFGENGSTGDRPLIKSKSSKVPFQRNQVDVFDLDCMFLGKLSNVRIGHNGKALADGWFLDRIVVREGLRATRAFNFQCKKWLSAKEGDGQIVRDLTLTRQIPVSELPSISQRKISSRRLSSSEDNTSSTSPVKTRKQSSDSSTSKTAKKNSREYFDHNDNFNDGSQRSNTPSKGGTKPASRNNSFSKKSKSPTPRRRTPSISSSDLSSDSETEREKREIEKRRRREAKRSTRDKSVEKPKANLGGIINKIDQNLNQKRNTRRSSSDSSQARRGRVTPNRTSPKPKPKQSPSPTPMKQESKGIKKTSKPESPKREEEDSSNKAPEKAETDSDSSSESSSSEVSSEEDNAKEQKSSPQKNDSDDEDKNDSDDEDKIEFSNKDTKKTYSGSSDDMYMAGFLAGIKANKVKDEEKKQEELQKQEFEETIKSGPTIHQCCEDGDLERVKELIAAVPDVKNKADERGWSPIHISAAFGHLDLVKWLSVSGVQLTAETPTGYTAIHLAAMNGHVNCIMILAAMGCPISSRTVDDFTPLHLAAMSGHIECVKWLLSNRAKVDVKDVNDRTPLDLAVEYQHDECIQLLKVMKKELGRKDSVMKMLRDPHALRKPSVDQAGSIVASSRGGDSGVGGESNDEEEWVSDTEDTSDVVGRGGDDRSDAARRTSIQVGRKKSVGRKISHTSGNAPSRRISKQEERQIEQLEEKKRNYETQKRKLVKRHSSFLDSIRQEVESGGCDQDF